MKIVLVLALAILLIGSGYAYQLTQQNRLKEQQVSGYQNQIRQLLSETETSSRARLQYTRQIDDLQSEVNALSSQLTSVSNQLQRAQQAQQGSVDIQVLEQELRQQLIIEFQQAGASGATGSRTGLMRQLAAMEPTERAEFMSMQNRYGDFLSTLDVGDERMEVVIGALGNMIAVENQARLDILRAVRVGQSDISVVRDQMLGIGNQESQLNELSYVLTEQELAAFVDYQDTRPSQNSTRFATFGSQVDGGIQSEAFFLGTAPDGSAVNGEIHVLSIKLETDN